MSFASQSDRFAGIDGVRAFAILGVIAAHAHVSWLHGGGVGVDVFFGISGFLITYITIKEAQKFGRISLKRFWLRRLLRLMPALLALVIAVDVLAIFLGVIRGNSELAQSLPATPSVLLYFSNWMIVGTNSAYLGWFGPLWSLSVEEQFYLVWPLIMVLAFMTARPLRVLAIAASVLSVAAAAARFFTFDGSNLYRTFGTDFRVDMLLVGALLAIALHAGKTSLISKASSALVIPAILYLAAVAIFVPEFGSPDGEELERIYYTVGLPLVGIATVSVIGFLVTHQSNILTRALAWKPIEYTGRISYGMYLWHYPITLGLRDYLDLSGNVLFLVALASTYIAAGLSWRFIETPLTARFHARLRPSAQHVS